MADAQAQSVYEAVGGDQFFVGLVDDFYAGVATDDLLRPMYPKDLGGAKARLAGFLIQYWGGPTDYSDQRGHPRLRMRHMRYPIDGAAAQAWLGHMRAALATAAPPQEVAAAMAAHFENTADFLRNTE